MNVSRHIRLSKTARLFLLFFALVIVSNSIYRHYSGLKPRQFVMGSDMEGYFQYLPHLFLKDIEEMRQMRWAKPYGEDRKLSAFTSGVAIMQTPFFLTAHAVSKFFDLESKGYNSVYFMFVLIATIFYSFTGLYFLFKSLRRIYSEKTAFIVVLSVFLGTNLFYYISMSPGMSHAYSFCLISLFIWFVPKFYENPGVKSSVKMILPLALAVLIRPTTIVAGFYFLLFGVYSFSDLGKRAGYLSKKWYLLVLMAIVALLVFFPQMLYWHYVTGKWFVYSYQSEGFSNALSPEIFTVLFGARNGWYIYTPLMLVSTLSLFYMVYRRIESAPAILLVITLIVYINSSWWLPTFSAAAGYRTLVEFIPFMAIPVGFLLEKNNENKAMYRLLLSVLAIFILYNLLFCFKYDGYLWWNTDWQWTHFKKLIQF